MKLSIVIPVYNTEKYLAACLESVIYPELSDYEIIIVNDGSTDSSREIAQAYLERYPALIRLISTDNGGLGHARNVGIESSDAEYLMFLDSDDALADKAVPEMLEALSSDDIYIFDFKFVNSAGNLLSVKHGSDAVGSICLEEHPELLMALPSACNKICRRTIFTDNSIRFHDRAWYEDLRTMPKLYLLTNRIQSLRKAWYIYYQRSGSITNNASLSRNLEIIDAVNELVEYYKRNGMYEKYRAELDYLRFYNVFLTASARICLYDTKSTMLDALRSDLLSNCPDYRRNTYIKAMPLAHKLLDFLMINGHYSVAAFLLRINERRKAG